MAGLLDMRNIGKTLEKRLNDAGINTPDELINTGSKDAYLRVKSVFPSACLMHLYAIEGQFEVFHWSIYLIM